MRPVLPSSEENKDVKKSRLFENKSNTINMENDTKIVQIIRSEWVGRQGDKMEDVLGLGDDSNMYRWHKSTGRWILWVINN